MDDECERQWDDIVKIYATAAEKSERIWKEKESLVVTSTCVATLPAPLLENAAPPRYRELEPTSSRDEDEVQEVNAGRTSSTLPPNRRFTLSCLCPRWLRSAGHLK